MIPYKAPLDDILFSLSHVSGAVELPDWDADLAEMIGAHFATFAEREIAPLDAVGDREGCAFEDGRVAMPEGFAGAFGALAAGGWTGLSMPERFGGQGHGAVYQAVVSEIFSGANHALQMLTALGPGTAKILLAAGSPGQQEKWIPQLVSGSALTTMCLTEPQAGSDLSRIACEARNGSAGWTLHGEKIFISGGDHDLTGQILHFVLARTSGGGLKGLSLFVCPAVLEDGARNAVQIGRVEDKMGLRASPTCHLVFDGARAELVGQDGQGLSAMFTLMNHARADVALQGAAHASRALHIASDYAASRVQGRNADGGDARLDQHPGVAAMIDEIEGCATSARGLAHMAIVAGQMDGAAALADILTPLAKVVGSTFGIRAAELGMQVLGGYGYLKDYRLEQTYRDVRVTAIYEGANSVLESAIARRLAPGPSGEALAEFAAAELARRPNAALSAALETWQVMRKAYPDLTARSVMEAAADVGLALLWGRVAGNVEHHRSPTRAAALATDVLAQIETRSAAGLRSGKWSKSGAKKPIS